MRLSRTWPFPLFPLSHPTPCYPRPSSGGPMHIPSHPNYVLRMLQSRLKKLATTSRSWRPLLDNTPTAVADRSAAVTTADPSIPASTSPSRRTARPAPSTCPKTCSPRSAHGSPNTNASRPCSTRSINCRWPCSGPEPDCSSSRRSDPDCGPGFGPDRPSLLPPTQPMAGPATRHARPGGLHLLHTLPGLVGAGPVPAPTGLPPSTRL